MLLPINPEHPEPRKIRQAVEVLEEAALSQMISPRIKKPRSIISLAIRPLSGI